MVPTASTLCFNACFFFFLCVQKHLEGEAEKSIIISEITLTKSENAMIMLNYIEKNWVTL